jgi:hypothetical protein
MNKTYLIHFLSRVNGIVCEIRREWCVWRSKGAPTHPTLTAAGKQATEMQAQTARQQQAMRMQVAHSGYLADLRFGTVSQQGTAPMLP